MPGSLASPAGKSQPNSAACFEKQLRISIIANKIVLRTIRATCARGDVDGHSHATLIGWFLPKHSEVNILYTPRAADPPARLTKNTLLKAMPVYWETACARRFKQRRLKEKKPANKEGRIPGSRCGQF
jgi:hypothetical protein